MNKTIVIFLLSAFISVRSTAQVFSLDPEDLYADAREYMLAGDYLEALSIFISLDEKGYSTPNISYLTGECYLNIPGQKSKATAYLKEAADHTIGGWTGETIDEQNVPEKVFLYLGIAYRLKEDFTKAIEYFNEYINVVDEKDLHSKAMAEYHIVRCRNAAILMESPASFGADTLKNTDGIFSGFNPLVTSDEKSLFYMNEQKFYDAIIQTVKDGDIWRNPENLTPEIKSDGDHYLTGLSDDGTVLLLTYYDPYFSGEIYSAIRMNGRWKKLEKMGDSINTRFNESHASLSPNEKVMYFTSDRPGGYGGLDIYRSEKTSDGIWGTPENLGPLINTPYNEETPFLAGDAEILFFSSQGHYNMGGYDVFYSTRDSAGNFLPPVNIGYPLNTTDDDVFLFPLNDGTIAYQARYSGNGQQNIVRYSIQSFGKPSRFLLNGKVELRTDDPEFRPDEITVTFVDKDINDTLAVNKLNNDGSFSQKLPGGSFNIDFSYEKQLLLTREIDIPNYLPQSNLVMNEQITIPRTVPIDTLMVKDIRFGFDNSNLHEDEKNYLKSVAEIMVNNPELTLVVNGYTDALGSEVYNQALSLKRAEAIVSFFKDIAGIDQRITGKGMGENNPVAVNINSDGTDSPDGRSYNRRAELIFSNIPDHIMLIRQNDIPVHLMKE